MKHLKSAVALLASLLVCLAAASAEEKTPGAAPAGAAVKADLSSPRAAFESFSKGLEALTAEHRKLLSSMQRRESEIYAKVLTPGLVELLKKGEAKQGTDDGYMKEGPLVYVKEEPAKDGRAAVHASQKNTVTEADFVDGKVRMKEVQVTANHRLEFVKADDGWRANKWLEECRECKGTGKCAECGGTRKTKETRCEGCGGTGKDQEGEGCLMCEGTGRLPAGECILCADTGGKCGSCGGEGFLRRDRFEDGALFAGETAGIGEYFDLSTPENAVKSYLNLEDRHEAAQRGVIAGLSMAIRGIIESWFGKEALAAIDAQIKKNTEALKAEMAQTRKEIGAAAVEGDTATVVMTLRSKTEEGEEVARASFRLVRADSLWRIDDRGMQCWNCNGEGVCLDCKGSGKTESEKCPICDGSGKDDSDGSKCPGCNGSGTTPVEPCPSCKECPGKCGYCGGAKYAWDRSRKDAR